MPDDKAQANALIDKYDGYFSSLDVNGLCHELSTIVMQWTYTVYEVFNVMSDRRYSQAALEQVATNLTERINDANLIELAKTMHGATLMARIQYLVNCQANPNQSICQRISTAFKLANDILRDKKKPNTTGQPRKLSDDEIAFYTERGLNQPFGPIKGGRVKGKARRLFNPEVIWELPAGGTGYVIYNRNDIDGRTQKGKSIGDKLGLDQIGTKETIERIMNIAREWNTLYSDRPLEIGDVSRPGGINTTEHSTHVGNEFDVRAQSKSKTVGPLDIRGNQDYSQSLTKEFILLVRRLYPGTKILFNDVEFFSKDIETNKFVEESSVDHYNHLHVILP